MDYESTPKKGTTTVGLLCTDGVILASEKRATMGNLVANKDTEKVLKIDEHLGMTIAGMVGDAQSIQRIMKAQTALYKIQRNREMTVQAAGSLMANILQEAKYFPFWLQVILGGHDSMPRLYSLDMSGSLIEEKSVSTGSGSPTAYGVIEAHYKEGKTVAENIPLAVLAVRTAIERDAFSGNGVNVAVIDKKGFRKLSNEEIEKASK